MIQRASLDSGTRILLLVYFGDECLLSDDLVKVQRWLLSSLLWYNFILTISDERLV